MSPPITFAVIWFLCLAALAFGLRFRRGPISIYVDWYRNVDLPAVVRNGPVVAPLMTALLIPALLLVTPAAFGLSVGIGWPVYLQKAVACGGLGYFLVVMGLSGAILSRLPAGLVPRWLREDDLAIGFRQPPSDLTDKATLAISLAIVIGGLAALVLAGSFLVTGHGLE